MEVNRREMEETLRCTIPQGTEAKEAPEKPKEVPAGQQAGGIQSITRVGQR